MAAQRERSLQPERKLPSGGWVGRLVNSEDYSAPSNRKFLKTCRDDVKAQAQARAEEIVKVTEWTAIGNGANVRR